MIAPDLQMGLVSYGLYVPEGRETASQIASRSGLTEEEVRGTLGLEARALPGPEDHPVPMAVAAAQKAFESAGSLTPGDVDVVIWTGEEHKDYPAQTASIRLQEEVGARKAWAFDLIGEGVTSLVGLRVAQALMVGDRDVRTVLLAGGTRNIDLVDTKDPGTRWMVPASASGAAMLLQKGFERNVVSGATIRVDEAMADDVFVPVGGTVRPYDAENVGSEDAFFKAARPEILRRYLAETLPGRLVDVARSAAGTESDLGAATDYLALRHLGPAARAAVLDGLGMGEEQTDGLADVGHHGPNDVLLSLDRGIRRGAVVDGSRVLLLSAGIGFCYGAALVTWGDGCSSSPEGGAR